MLTGTEHNYSFELVLQCFKQLEGKERSLSSHTFPPGSGRGGEKTAEREICEGGELLCSLQLEVQTKKKKNLQKVASVLMSSQEK